MPKIIIRSFVTALVVLAAVCAAPAQQKAGRPNFVIVLADDLGFSDLGCYGGEIKTPNLDRLAAEGLRFTQFYNTGRCWPTRAAILTGYYPQQIRMDPAKKPWPEWARILPHYLEPAGYRCYHSGKWHLHTAPKVIADGGFHRAYLTLDHNRNFSPQRAELDDQVLPPVPLGSGHYSTTAIAEHAIDFLKQHAEQHADKPFLLYLAYIVPHFPLHALQEDIDRYRHTYLEGWDVIRERRYQRLRQAGFTNSSLPRLEPETVPSWNFAGEVLRERIGPGEAPLALPWYRLTEEQKQFQALKMAIHAAMIDRMDQETGRVLEQIRRMGADDNTVVIFLSDNGASAEQIIRGDEHDKAAPPGSAMSYLCLGPGWSSASNTPFRRHKHWTHEGGIATPLIVRWKNGIAARGELRHTVGHVIDFVPTILDLAGITPAVEWKGHRPPPLPGISLAPAFARDVQIERPYLFFSHQGNYALRAGDWKLVQAAQEKRWELYDLSADRAESRDLALAQPERVREMERMWAAAVAEFNRQAGLD